MFKKYFLLITMGYCFGINPSPDFYTFPYILTKYQGRIAQGESATLTL